MDSLFKSFKESSIELKPSEQIDIERAERHAKSKLGYTRKGKPLSIFSETQLINLGKAPYLFLIFYV